MRLTNEMKRKIVVNVMAELPRIDYGTQMRERFSALQLEHLKKQEVFKDVTWKDVTDNFNAQSVYILDMVFLGYLYKSIDEHKDTVMLDLHKKRWDQNNKHKNLRTSLTGALESVTTVKKLLEMYPEFEKHLNLPPVKKQLPATNVIKELMEAGWTKPEDKGQK